MNCFYLSNADAKLRYIYVCSIMMLLNILNCSIFIVLFLARCSIMMYLCGVIINRRAGNTIKTATKKMKTITIKTGWHKANDKLAATYKQLDYIHDLRNEENCPDWPFSSTTNAMRSLTKSDASEIIDALRNGDKIVFE